MKKKEKLVQANSLFPGAWKVGFQSARQKQEKLVAQSVELALQWNKTFDGVPLLLHIILWEVLKSFSLVVENEFRKKKDLNLGVQLPFLAKICIHTASMLLFLNLTIIVQNLIWRCSWKGVIFYWDMMYQTNRILLSKLTEPITLRIVYQLSVSE